MTRFFLFIAAIFTTTLCNADIVPSAIDFGKVTSGSNVQPVITIKNDTNVIWQIGDIADTNPVNEPFSIIAGNCANTILQTGGQCTFMVLFSPASSGIYTDSFNIDIVNQGLSFVVSLQGEGGDAIDEPDILVSFSSVNFGLVDVLDNESALPYKFEQLIQNNGKLDLVLSAFDLSGKDQSEISILGTCTNVLLLSPGNFCSLSIEFKPLIQGEKYAEISIFTSDPDENPFLIPVRGIATGEDDGVSAAVEDAGENSGDGNNDGILDSKQSNVVTFNDSIGNSVTIVTDNAYRFVQMSSTSQVATPADFEIGSGIFDFIVEGGSAGELMEVGIILPAGVVPSKYFMYGPTADELDPHWYVFDFDGETGAIIIGDVSILNPITGVNVTRSVLKVISKDGGRGDNDLTVNGSVAVTSGMPVNQNSDDGFLGSLNMQIILIVIVTTGLTRRIS